MIDAHIHLYGSDLHPETLSEGSRLGITLFVGSSLLNYTPQPTYEETIQANDDMAKAIRNHPGQVEGYCYVNPRHGHKSLMDFRRRVEEQGFIGLKLWIATLCNDPLVFPYVEQAIQYKAPILVHAWKKTISQFPYESTAHHVADLAARYPEARIIMAHLGGQMESAINIIEPYENVYADTSGTPIGGSEVGYAVKRLGAKRIIFGSDLPFACMASNLGKIVGANLSETDFRLVTYENMKFLIDEVKQNRGLVKTVY
ncbi:amidohydrolase family protein [Cohnella silvisoli]|uniref:Amidohydrolase family protein n=1 Tax=Cohnella silvisoli TaxID=2873699 RepID=A0ABV1L2D8_9BACL|nr:amidohydrolase family protein [Cohnella silvisoli]MCD9025310.1 amidohydrolase family protein [Cohnella silvisoli]